MSQWSGMIVVLVATLAVLATLLWRQVRSGSGTAGGPVVAEGVDLPATWPHATSLQAGADGWSTAGVVAAGGALGAGWGAVARFWMHFAAPDPQFTLGGSGYVVLAPAVVGALAGLALAARRNGWRGSSVVRALGAGSVLLLGMGAGIMVLPAVACGAAAVSFTRGRAAGRWVLGTAAVVITVGATATTWDDSIGRDLALTVTWLPLFWLLVLAVRISLLDLPRGSGDQVGATSK